MSGAQNQLEIKFRLTDGSDIGPRSFPAATSVANLKESVLAQWPKEMENRPRTVKEVKLISAGKILENNRTLADCRSPLCEIPGGVTTMHVVVQPPAGKGHLQSLLLFLPASHLSLNFLVDSTSKDFLPSIKQKVRMQTSRSRTSACAPYYSWQFSPSNAGISSVRNSDSFSRTSKPGSCLIQWISNGNGNGW